MYKDLEAALVCVALRMGKQPETGLLLDKRVPTNDVNVLIVSYLDLFTQFIAIYKKFHPNFTRMHLSSHHRS